MSLLGRMYDVLPACLKPVQFKIVESAQELQAASRLVYREYLRRNYVRTNAAQMRLSLYQTLPTTVTFVACHYRYGVVATATLVQDSPLGLPMDEAYKTELDGLRRRGLRVAEVTMLALDSEVFPRKTFTMFDPKKLLTTLRLFKVLFDYVRNSTTCDEMVACFNPKHQILYDFLRLTPLGGLKTYTGANGHPSIARHFNIQEAQRTGRSHVAYQLFYGRCSSARRFSRRLRLTANELRQLFMVQFPILQSASPTELAYIKSCYPTYDFHAILQPIPAISSVSVS